MLQVGARGMKTDRQIVLFILTVPRITAPVYLDGNFAAIPNTVFWYTPFATKT